MGTAAVIFDLDGVLIDSGAAHHQSWRLLAAELGQEVTAGRFAASFGRQNRDIIPLLFGGGDDEARIRRLSERKEALYRDLVRGRIPALPGAVALVRDCRRSGLKLAIGSSAPVENIHLALEEMGIADCFDAVVHDADVTRGKPDPEVFLIAAERLGVPPGDCVVIEDAPSGVQAALAAGMKAVGLTTYHAADRLAAANLVVDHLSDLSRAAILSI
jgi:beta-phosphoglucomutase family hydrolase